MEETPLRSPPGSRRNKEVLYRLLAALIKLLLR